MTQRKRLVPLTEVESYLVLAQRYGVEIGSIDIRENGITINPRSAANDPLIASVSSTKELDADAEFERWKARQQPRKR